jgi:ATP-dependent Clp protease ATP-binding subunit ClpC
LPKESVAREAADDRYEEMKGMVMRELRDHLAPELLGRIDKTIVFSPLSQAELLKITDLQIKDLAKRLALKQIKLDVSKGVREEIATKAFTDGAGARPIRAIVQELLEDPIASSVINEEVSAGQAVVARKSGGKVMVTTK